MSSRMVQVSVIIPVYNGEKYIRETLDSVFAQTFKDLEVIVIDDASTDGTADLVRSYGDKIIFLHNHHCGPACSRNLGIDAARGSLIAFLDADDIWLPAKLERQVAVATAHPEYGIISTDVATFDETGIIEASAAAHKSIPTGYVLESILFDNWIGTSCAMVRKECFDKLGLFDEEQGIYGSDWMMWVRIAACYPVCFIDEVLVQYRLHADSYSHSNESQQFRNLFRNLEKLQKAVPQLTARPGLLHEAAFRICWQRGWNDLQGIRLRGARDKLRRALYYKPYSAKVWASLGIAWAPPVVLRLLKRALKTARRRLLVERRMAGRSRSMSRD